MRDRGRPRLDIDLQWTPEERDRLDSMSTETRWLNREAWARLRSNVEFQKRRHRLLGCSWWTRGQVMVDGFTPETRRMVEGARVAG
jgi:hypothetical protein